MTLIIKKKYYSIKSQNKRVLNYFESHNKIKEYIDKHIKCVFLSTTDEDLDSQSKNLLNDLIFKYFEKKDRDIKKSIEEFKNSYKRLNETFNVHIKDIEGDLGKTFIDVDIVPKLSLDLEKDITNFLSENINLKLDDSYEQEVSVKGAGVQRASLILLTVYLLSKIYSEKCKIILLDEPEAFLYPLLERRLKLKLENTVLKDNGNNTHVFMTSHSSTYLGEMGNSDYSFSYFRQKIEEREYKRSANSTDKNKYTCIETMNRANKYEVLKNYGLLDEVNDYEYVIVCEGETDSNYIRRILEGKPDMPQIRFGKFSDGIAGKQEDLKYDYIGKGANAILPILVYLETVSNVKRKVFVLLDGDNEGKEVNRKIRQHEFNNLSLKIYPLPDGKVIEDVVFSKDEFVNRVLEKIPEMQKYQNSFKAVFDSLEDNKSFINQTKSFIEGNNLKGISMSKLKSMISQNLDEVNLCAKKLLRELELFFYNE